MKAPKVATRFTENDLVIREFCRRRRADPQGQVLRGLTSESETQKTYNHKGTKSTR